MTKETRIILIFISFITFIMLGLGVDAYPLMGDDCMTCHGPGGMSTKKIDMDTLKDGIHGGINSGAALPAGVDTENKVCWACHAEGDAPSITSPTDNQPMSCEACHTTGEFEAPLVFEHFPAGEDIKTAANCEVCHVMFTKSPQGIAHEPTALSLVWHYGVQPSPFTSDCSSCHTIENMGATFGGAPIITGGQGAYSHLPTYSNNDCYSCHSDGKKTDFHDRVLEKKLLSTVSCIFCHDGRTALADGLIDGTVFDVSEHSGIATAESSGDDRNCEICHFEDAGMGYGFEVSDENTRTCTDCHLVVEHIENGEDIATSAECTDCHSK